MVFQDKLIFLMELTSTSNKQLADAIRVDPSLISRLRSGNRQVPQNAEYLEAMANFFASRFKTKYQIEALSDIIGNAHLSRSTDMQNISDNIATWLSSNVHTHQSQAGLFLHSFDQLKKYDLKTTATEPTHATDRPEEGNIYAFHGNEGRLQANLLFDKLVVSSEIVGEVKLLTEGNTDWLWSDKESSLEISNYIKLAINRGSTFTRIVPRMDNLSMAFDSVTRWLPLYETGKVTPYYYPHIRDNVFRRTLYVAPGIAAMFSTAIGKEEACSTTFLTTNPLIIESLDKEYTDYLKMCRPATTLYTDESSPFDISKCFQTFFQFASNSISILSGLSLLSTPSDVLMEHNSLKEGSDFEQLTQDHALCFANFEKQVAQHNYTEVFYLESFENIIAGKARIVALRPFLNKTLYYTPDKYQRHLMKILFMLNSYPQYHVILKREIDLESCIYVNQSYLFIIPQTTSSLRIYKTDYTDLVSSVWEFALSKTKNGLSDVANRVESISEIKQLIQKLSNY